MPETVVPNPHSRERRAQAWKAKMAFKKFRDTEDRNGSITWEEAFAGNPCWTAGAYVTEPVQIHGLAECTVLFLFPDGTYFLEDPSG